MVHIAVVWPCCPCPSTAQCPATSKHLNLTASFPTPTPRSRSARHGTLEPPSLPIPAPRASPSSSQHGKNDGRPPALAPGHGRIESHSPQHTPTSPLGCLCNQPREWLYISRSASPSAPLPVPLCARALSRLECRSPPRPFVSPSHPGQQMAHLSRLGLADAPPGGDTQRQGPTMQQQPNLEVASSFARLYPLSPRMLWSRANEHMHTQAPPPPKAPSPTTYPSPLSPSCPCWSPKRPLAWLIRCCCCCLTRTQQSPRGPSNLAGPGRELAGEPIFASHKSKSKQQLALPPPSVVRPPTPAAAGNSNRSAIGPPLPPSNLLRESCSTRITIGRVSLMGERELVCPSQAGCRGSSPSGFGTPNGRRGRDRRPPPAHRVKLPSNSPPFLLTQSLASCWR